MDEGQTFETYYFAKEDGKILVTDILTEPTSTSRKFLVIGREAEWSTKYVTIRIDFSGYEQRKCLFLLEKQVVDLNAVGNSASGSNDFEVWTPKNWQEKCIFGHEVWLCIN